MVQDQRSLLDDLREELRDLDDELVARDSKIAELEDAVRGKDGELQDLEELIMQKDRILSQLNEDILSAEEMRRLENENRRKREIEEIITKANQPRKPYVPIKGDPVDEMMAKHINECPFFVPLERLAEGHYMVGTKKVYAKIMNGKLMSVHLISVHSGTPLLISVY